MKKINSELILLENLSKQISDLIHINSFDKITELDAIRQSIIKNIHLNKSDSSNAKDKLKKLIQNNNSMILILETKLKRLNINHNKFNKIFQAYDQSN